ncbi:unnamed protein product, partial [Effrenium voratum]
AKPPVTSPARNTPSTGFLECCSPSRMMRCCSRCLFTAEDGSSTLSVWSSELRSPRSSQGWGAFRFWLGSAPAASGPAEDARAGLANVLHHQARHTCHRSAGVRWSGRASDGPEG